MSAHERTPVNPNHPKYNEKAAARCFHERVPRPCEGAGKTEYAHSNDKGHLLHLSPVVDHQLRGLPPADPGQLEDRAPSLRGR